MEGWRQFYIGQGIYAVNLRLLITFKVWEMGGIKDTFIHSYLSYNGF